MVRKYIIGATCACVTVFSFGANAVLYDLFAVINGIDSDFSFSGFHYAGNDGSGLDGNDNAADGRSLADIADFVSGSYDSASGIFNAVLTLADASTVTLSGTDIIFDSGLLGSVASIDLDFSAPPPDLSDTTINFQPGYVCCGSNDLDPNSFFWDGPILVMSLWGSNADGTISDVSGSIGMALRVSLNVEPAVPVPAAVWLFGSGLIGLVGLARRKKA